MVIFPAPRTDIKNAGQVQSRWHGDCRKGGAGDGVDGGNWDAGGDDAGGGEDIFSVGSITDQ